MAIATDSTSPKKVSSKKRKRDKLVDAPTEACDIVVEERRKKRSKSGVTKKEKERAAGEDRERCTDRFTAVATLDRKEHKKIKKEARRQQELRDGSCAGTAKPCEATPPLSSDVQSYLLKNSITIHGAPPSSPIVPWTSFDQLQVHKHLRSALSEFKQPTPIQACSWPALTAKKDVIGIAETGSGKTLAFGIPAMSRLLDNSLGVHPTISVLVIAPTRELAMQTHETLNKLAKPFDLSSVCVFGGVGKNEQIRDLKRTGTRILVGTPGRLLDLANEGACDLTRVRYLVLDEADRMLDTGFENDIKQIIQQTEDSSIRQTVMFSATWPDSVKQLANSFLRDPVRIVVGNEELTANGRVEQVLQVFDDPWSKDSRLLNLLRSFDEHSRILIFALYKKEAARVECNLRRKGYSVGALHGDLSQQQRIATLSSFKEGKTKLLVATDVAARGLDIPNVALVINYSFPLTIEDYVHRIGRTGRGGHNGKAITFFTGENHERALAGELARVLREGGFDATGLGAFPMAIKKKEHGAYGAFYRRDIAVPAATKIRF